MNKLELINKYYTKESIIKILTSYVLYYQISLGSYVFETIQNDEESIKKLCDLNLTLTPNEILLSIAEIIFSEHLSVDMENHFDELVKKKAMYSSLKDFVLNDHELLNKENYEKHKRMEILTNELFNSKMKMQFLSEYSKTNQNYSQMITDSYSSDVKKIIIKNFLKDSV
jgi:hypothetical protein